MPPCLRADAEVTPASVEERVSHIDSIPTKRSARFEPGNNAEEVKAATETSALHLKDGALQLLQHLLSSAGSFYAAGRRLAS